MNPNNKSTQKNKKKGKKSDKKKHNESAKVSNESVAPSKSEPKPDVSNNIETVKEKVAQVSLSNDGAVASDSRSDPFMRNCKTNSNESNKHSNDTRKAECPLKQDKRSIELEEALDTYMNCFRLKKNMEYKCVEEIEADLFAMKKEYHLGHCVAEDFNMGSGIALEFRKLFKQVDVLLNQRVKQGGLGLLESDGRYIYYLVTKRESNGKPTLETLFKSVYKMKCHIVENDVKMLALPRIGCGLDRLEWSEVKNMLEFVFTGTECKITICNYQMAQESVSVAKSKHQLRKCNITQVFDADIKDIEEYSIIVYLGSEDARVTPQISKLDSHFKIMKEYRNSARIGTTVLTKVQQDKYLIYGCIVKRKQYDPVDYVQFLKCIADINKMNLKLKPPYFYVAMLKENDNDNLLMSKIVNLMRNCFHNVDILLYPNPSFPKGQNDDIIE